jgi:hypothetical protein
VLSLEQVCHPARDQRVLTRPLGPVHDFADQPQHFRLVQWLYTRAWLSAATTRVGELARPAAPPTATSWTALGVGWELTVTCNVGGGRTLAQPGVGAGGCAWVMAGG